MSARTIAPRTDFIEAYSFPGGHGAAAPAKLRIAESPARMSGAMFDTWRPTPPSPGRVVQINMHTRWRRPRVAVAPKENLRGGGGGGSASDHPGKLLRQSPRRARAPALVEAEAPQQRVTGGAATSTSTSFHLAFPAFVASALLTRGSSPSPSAFPFLACSAVLGVCHRLPLVFAPAFPGVHP